MEIEWNEIKAGTIIDWWNFSWDLNIGPPQRIDGGNNSSWETWGYSSGKRKSSKISQKEVHYNFRHRLFQRFRNTPVFIGQLLPFYFAPSHCSPRKTCIDVQIPIDILLFSQQRSTVLLDGNWNRWPTQCIHYRSFSQNSETVLEGSPQKPIHSRLW